MTETKTAIADASGVIFDVDGTLVDTVDFHAEAWKRTFAAFGLDIDQAAIRAQIGKGGDQLMPIFLDPDRLRADGEAIETFRSDLFKREYLQRVQGFSDVRPLFDAILERGIKIALGSSAKGEELEIYKKAAGIDDLSLEAATSEDAEKSKPHPDIFQAALGKIGLPADRTVVVGDSPYDAEAAANAGMASIGLLCGGFDEASLRSAGMREIYAGPTELLAAIRAAD